MGDRLPRADHARPASFSAAIGSPRGPAGEILWVDPTGLVARFDADVSLPAGSGILLHVDSRGSGCASTFPVIVAHGVSLEATCCVRFACGASSAGEAAFAELLGTYFEAHPEGGARGVDIVEDDPACARLLCDLCESVGIEPAIFPSASSFLAAHSWRGSACRIVDVRMAGLSGLELHRELTRLGSIQPTIFVTGHATVAMAVDAMKAGAFWFFEKPVDDQALLDAVHAALQMSTERWKRVRGQALAQARLHALTAREREVLDRLLGGRSSKMAAVELGLSKKTVDHHRASIMRKLHVASTAELVVAALRTPEYREKHLASAG